MAIDTYYFNHTGNAITTIKNFVAANPLPNNYELVCFEDSMSNKELQLYAPFHLYSDANMPGLKPSASVEEEIDKMNKSFKLADCGLNDSEGNPIKTSKRFYFYLKYQGNTIGRSNRRVLLSSHTLLFDLLFLHQDYRGNGLGRAFLASTIDYILKQQRIQYIQVPQIHDKNGVMIHLVTSLGFKKK
jgi:GNAT superfamily N-acetyltransferase